MAVLIDLGDPRRPEVVGEGDPVIAERLDTPPESDELRAGRALLSALHAETQRVIEGHGRLARAHSACN